MGKKLCSCGENLNLGVKSTANFGVAKKIGFMEMNDNNGDANFLDLSVEWNAAFWNGRLADPEFTQRLLLTADLEDYVPSVSDAQTVTRASGKQVITQKGVTSFEMYIDDADGTMFNALDALTCKQIGFFIFDDCGAVAGSENVADELSPKKIGGGTMDVQYMLAQDTDTQRIKIKFSLDLSESPAWEIVGADEQTDTILDLKSVCDGELVGTPTVLTTTQLVGDLAAYSSFAKMNIPAEGLETVGNWLITDSAGATSVPTLVTESLVTAGNYTFDYAAITAGLTKFYYLDNNFEITFTATVV